MKINSSFELGKTEWFQILFTQLYDGEDNKVQSHYTIEFLYIFGIQLTLRKLGFTLQLRLHQLFVDAGLTFVLNTKEVDDESR